MSDIRRELSQVSSPSRVVDPGRPVDTSGFARAAGTVLGVLNDQRAARQEAQKNRVLADIERANFQENLEESQALTGKAVPNTVKEAGDQFVAMRDSLDQGSLSKEAYSLRTETLMKRIMMEEDDATVLMVADYVQKRGIEDSLFEEAKMLSGQAQQFRDNILEQQMEAFNYAVDNFSPEDLQGLSEEQVVALGQDGIRRENELERVREEKKAVAELRKTNLEIANLQDQRVERKLGQLSREGLNSNVFPVVNEFLNRFDALEGDAQSTQALMRQVPEMVNRVRQVQLQQRNVLIQNGAQQSTIDSFDKTAEGYIAFLEHLVEETSVLGADKTALGYIQTNLGIEGAQAMPMLTAISEVAPQASSVIADIATTYMAKEGTIDTVGEELSSFLSGGEERLARNGFIRAQQIVNNPIDRLDEQLKTNPNVAMGKVRFKNNQGEKFLKTENLVQKELAKDSWSSEYNGFLNLFNEDFEQGQLNLKFLKGSTSSLFTKEDAEVLSAVAQNSPDIGLGLALKARQSAGDLLRESPRIQGTTFSRRFWEIEYNNSTAQYEVVQTEEARKARENPPISLPIGYGGTPSVITNRNIENSPKVLEDQARAMNQIVDFMVMTHELDPKEAPIKKGAGPLKTNYLDLRRYYITQDPSFIQGPDSQSTGQSSDQ